MPSRASLILRSEQPKLRGRVAVRLRQTEMAEGVGSEKPTPRGALDEAALDQERLYDLLDGVARFREGGCNRLDPDRAAAEILRHHGQVFAVHEVETDRVDVEQ